MKDGDLLHILNIILNIYILKYILNIYLTRVHKHRKHENMNLSQYIFSIMDKISIYHIKYILIKIYISNTICLNLCVKTFSSVISVSEMRLVLLGDSWYDKSLVANLLLGPDTFNPEEESDISIKATGKIQTTKAVLINTPDLLCPSISESKLKKYVNHCVTLSDPGPHVFLLVVQQNITDQQKQRLCRILELFSENYFKHSLVLISTPGWETSGSNCLSLQPSLPDLIRMCGKKWIKLQPDPTELLLNLSEILKNNYWNHVTSGRPSIEPVKEVSSLLDSSLRLGMYRKTVNFFLLCGFNVFELEISHL